MDLVFSQPHSRPSSPKDSFTNSQKKRRRGPISQALQTPVAIKGNPLSMLTPSSSSSALRGSRYLSPLDSTNRTHAQIIKGADEWTSDSRRDNLLEPYSDSEDFRSLARLLIMGSERGAPPLSYFLDSYDNGGANPLAWLEIFQEMHRKGMIFSAGVLTSALRICAELVDLLLGLQIHGFTIKVGLDSDASLKCSMIDFYADCWSLESADKLFEEISLKGTIMWNKVLMLYVESGRWSESLDLFRRMQDSSVKADEVTVAKVLQACGRLEALKEGKEIHGYVTMTGLSSSLFVSNSLIAMYSKNSSVESARRVFQSMRIRSLVSWNSIISCCSLSGFLDGAWELFNEMISSGMEPDLVTWNCLISGHSLHGSDDKVLKLFRGMQIDGLKPNSSSITSVLRTVVDSGLLESGKEIHGYVVRHGLESNVYVGTSLVDMYIKCCGLASARKVFNSMKNRNVFTWNSLISGYAYDGLLAEALELLKQMERECIQPDLTTWNGLISGYSMHGLGRQALVLIHQLKAMGVNPNVVSWTALISGCCQNGHYEDALHFVTEMQNEGIHLNSFTVATLLRACAGLSSLKKGAELHCFAIRKGFHGDISVDTALIDMYCKSGGLQTGLQIFKMIQNKNLASWNAMMMGFAAYGRGDQAISLFNEMCRSGTEPDGITFTALLSGCRHSGLISEGWRFFDDMRINYEVTPTLEHYTCMVDLLARGGYLDEAWDFIQGMPLEPDAGVWGSLLGACRTHQNIELAEIAAKNLFELEPYNPANYFLMMSLYAYKNQWEDVEKMNDAMDELGVKRRSGWSWIQIDRTVHVFAVGGENHPDIGEIYFELYQLVSEMRKLGYVPDTSCVAHNVGDEEKEKLLMSHTEKLAMVYGLINTDKGMPVRVIKNSRVCNDCHSMAKFLSRLRGRVIVLRDGNRFHHINGGSCTCNDYW